jgi:GAF domain-containing protein
MIGLAYHAQPARIALDVGEEAVDLHNPYLPKTHSELALPLMNKEVCYGALSIQSQKAHAFAQDAIRIFEGIADAIAVAIDNNRLFSEITQQLNESRF